MARKKNYNFYDDAFKATAVKLTEMPGVVARDVAAVLVKIGHPKPDKR